MMSCVICVSHQHESSLREGAFVSLVQIYPRAVASPSERLSLSPLPALPSPRSWSSASYRAVGTSCHLVSATPRLHLSLEFLLGVIISAAYLMRPVPVEEAPGS